MNPLAFFRLIPTKVWAFLAIILLVGIGLWMYGNWRYEQGASAVRQEWDADILAMEREHTKALEQRAAENLALQETHLKQLAEMKGTHANEIARIRHRHGELLGTGLRLPASLCPGSAAAGSPQAEGGKGGDGAVAGTVVLPEQVTRNLRQLMAEAETIVAGCRVGQGFLKQHGFVEE